MMMAAVLCLSVFAMTSFADAAYTETVDGISVTYGDPEFSSDGFILRYSNDGNSFHDIPLLSSNISMSDSIVTAFFESDELEFTATELRIGFVCEIPLTYDVTPASVTCDPVVITTGNYYYLDSNYDQQAFMVTNDSAVHLLDDNRLLVTVWQNYDVGSSQSMVGVLGNSITFDVSGLVSPVAGSGGSGSDEDDGDAELQGTSMDQLLQDTGTVASTTLSVVSSSVATITENPFLLMTAGLLLLGAAVGILRRLLNRG